MWFIIIPRWTIWDRIYGPTIICGDVCRWCASCCQCQLMNLPVTFNLRHHWKTYQNWGRVVLKKPSSIHTGPQWKPLLITESTDYQDTRTCLFLTEPYTSGVVVPNCPYPLPEHKKHTVQDELKVILNMEVVNESHTDWCSANVLVQGSIGYIGWCWYEVDGVRKSEMTSYCNKHSTLMSNVN